MIHAELLRAQGVLMITPEGALQQSDFEGLARLVDPYIEVNGELRGVMIYTKSFIHWDSFKALLAHMKFVKNHEQHVRRIAVVTDDSFLSIVPSIMTHFIHADVKHFDYADREGALAWLKS